MWTGIITSPFTNWLLHDLKDVCIKFASRFFIKINCQYMGIFLVATDFLSGEHVNWWNQAQSMAFSTLQLLNKSWSDRSFVPASKGNWGCPTVGKSRWGSVSDFSAKQCGGCFNGDLGEACDSFRASFTNLSRHQILWKNFFKQVAGLQP